MKLGNFSFAVNGIPDKNGYISLPHNTQYSIYLKNYDIYRACDAEVSIDGKDIGTFRIKAGRDLRLERSSVDGQDGHFTFYRSGSKQAQLSDEKKIAKNNKGLISVTFKPEKTKTATYRYIPRIPWFPPSIPNPDYPYYPIDTLVMNSNNGTHGSSLKCCSHTETKASAGITGQSGHSNQTFYEVENLDYDTGAFVTIHLRLVCSEKDNTPRALISKPKIKSTKIPAPIN